MAELSTELLIVLLLVAVNGLFAMAEAALVSARKSRLSEMADEGDERAAIALALAKEPARALAAMQLGLTTIAVMVGAFSAVRLGGELAGVVADLPYVGAQAQLVAQLLVVGALVVAIVVLGELVPRRIAQIRPEGVARALAPTVKGFTRLVGPVVGALAALTHLVLRPLGLKERPRDSALSEEELALLIEQGVTAGTFNKAEKEMVAGVLELDQLPVTALMTPRPRMVFLNLDDPEEVNWRKIVASGHSHFPIYQSTRDQVVGMVSVKSIWANSAFGLSTHLRSLMVPPLIVPETMTGIQLLEQFKRSSRHVALIADEFGGIQGLVTLIDVLEAIVGDIAQQGRRAAPETRQRDDGSWLIDATLSADELKTLLQVDELPQEDSADYQTVGGLVVTQFGRIPRAGDHFEWDGWRFEVMDMDRNRVDKVLVGRAVTTTTALPKAG